MLVKTKIKYIQSLGQKKFRDGTGVFIAEGPKIVKELLDAGPALVREVYALPEWITENRHLLKNTHAEEISEAELEKISQLKTPNKVLALAGQFTYEPLELKGRLTLALCGIQDPGNLGTIIRIADWFGITQVVCSEDSADLYNPKVVQSTMGSIARVHVYYTDLAGLARNRGGVDLYATVLDGQDVTGIEKPGQGILLIGNESRGIPPELLQMANVRITIPKKGGAESLNAAVATGIILSHLT
ncbi:MAG: RNA methyltransferase [Sphingobacteriales bacterium]|nr:RNA methyltransferase [Sphingobacteriales bacterium]